MFGWSPSLVKPSDNHIIMRNHESEDPGKPCPFLAHTNCEILGVCWLKLPNSALICCTTTHNKCRASFQSQKTGLNKLEVIHVPYLLHPDETSTCVARFTAWSHLKLGHKPPLSVTSDLTQCPRLLPSCQEVRSEFTETLNQLHQLWVWVRKWDFFLKI